MQAHGIHYHLLFCIQIKVCAIKRAWIRVRMCARSFSLCFYTLSPSIVSFSIILDTNDSPFATHTHTQRSHQSDNIIFIWPYKIETWPQFTWLILLTFDRLLIYYRIYYYGAILLLVLLLLPSSTAFSVFIISLWNNTTNSSILVRHFYDLAIWWRVAVYSIVFILFDPLRYMCEIAYHDPHPFIDPMLQDFKLQTYTN